MSHQPPDQQARTAAATSPEAGVLFVHDPQLGQYNFGPDHPLRPRRHLLLMDLLEKAGILHVRVGKVSFEADKLYENAMVIVDSVIKAKPASSKGRYLKSVTLSSTMGPGIRLDTTTLSKTGS